MEHRIELPFGHIDIVDFPTETRTLLDFPDDHVVVGTAATITKENRDTINDQYRKDLEKGEALYYQLYMVPPKDRRDLKTEFAMEEARRALMEYVADQPQYSGKRIIGGLKRLDKAVAWAINPAAIKNTKGTVQLLHGVSSGNRDIGTNNMELYFPRGIYFNMVGNQPHRQLLPPSLACFSGSVTFAKREYRFRLSGNSTGWNKFSHVVELTPEYIEYVRNIKRMTNVISMADVDAAMRAFIHCSFPFIADYDMLGKFRFDRIPTPEEETAKVESWMNGRGTDRNKE